MPVTRIYLNTTKVESVPLNFDIFILQRRPKRIGHTAPVDSRGAVRDQLATRQREVLDDLLAGRTPPGFDAAGTTATTRVLHHKRSSAAHHAAPELDLLPDWRARFHAWAVQHPQQGCAHDDVRAFLATTDEGWLRLHEVYDGRRRWALTRIAGRRVLTIGLGSQIWHLERRTWKRSSPWKT